MEPTWPAGSRCQRPLIASLSTIIVPGGAVVLLPYLILQATGVSSIAQFGPMEIGSLILGLIGLSMVVWVSVAFVTQGKGTPAPIEPPKNFVAAGLYRFLRNPMYFGALLTVFAEAPKELTPEQCRGA